jgi:hypothetical protein
MKALRECTIEKVFERVRASIRGPYYYAGIRVILVAWGPSLRSQLKRSIPG